MKYTALIPVKDLGLAKSRLEPYLSPQQRATLVLDMLQHVVHTLRASAAFERVAVVSADPRVLDLVQQWGALPLRETQRGHNPALQEAAHALFAGARCGQGDLCASWTTRRAQGRLASLADQMACEGLLTISADLPLLAHEDICALLQAAEHAQVVLAGSSDSTGTNALLTRPPLVLPYLFGPNSLPAYIQAAQANELSYTLVQNAHLGLDIDTLADLTQLEQSGGSWSRVARFAI